VLEHSRHINSKIKLPFKSKSLHPGGNYIEENEIELDRYDRKGRGHSDKCSANESQKFRVTK
jgi:hypothetical protein